MNRIGVLLLFASAICLAASAATLTVGADKTYQTPAAALAAASDGDVILIDDGTYVLEAELQVEKGVTFKSASGDRAACVISGGDAVPVVYIPNSVGKTVTFDSLTLTHGAGAANRAAGITMSENGTANMRLTVTNCVISHCVNSVSGYGGAAFLRVTGTGSTITISDCEVHHNQLTVSPTGGASAGLGFWYSKNTLIERCRIHDNTGASVTGGGLNLFQGDPRCVSCTIYDNMAGNAGGLVLSGASVAIEDCIISNNTATSTGGGVRYGSGGEIRDSVICCNKAANGGGLSGDNLYGTLSGCTIRDNEATSGTGGGLYMMYIKNPGFNVLDCTITGNKAKTTGGGIYQTSQWSDKPLVLRQCLIAGNSAKDGGGVCIDFNVTSTFSCELDSVTFAGNTVTGTGAGLYLKSTLTLEETYGRVTAVNCAVCGNTANGAADAFVVSEKGAGSFADVFTTSAFDVEAQTPAGNVYATGDIFVDAPNGDYTPVYQGALYDAATTRSWMTDDATDLLGNRRVSTFGTPKKPDIGAIEWQAHSKFAECAAAGHPHKDVDPGYPATCEQPGLADGIWCPDCETVLSVKEEIPALGHLLGPVEFVYYAPSAVTPGLQRRHCTRPGCGKEVKEEIPALGFAHAEAGTAEVLAKEAALGDEGGVVYVARDGVDAEGRGAKATPFATVAGALANTSAASPIEIRVLHGVYALAAPITLNANRTVTLCGAAGDRDCVVIDAQNACVGIDISGSAVVTLKDLSVVRGKNEINSGVNGGAVNAHASTVLITNCTMAASTGKHGAGGVGFESCAAARLVDSDVVACTNLFGGSWCYGGGVYFKDNTAMTMSGNRVALCYSADGGGGASSQHGSFSNCTFYGNVAKNSGGGVYMFHSLTCLSDCYFEGNSAKTQNGGGFYVDTEGGARTIENCTVVGNMAKSKGGGVHFEYMNAKSTSSDGMLVRNCTVRGNAVTDTGYAAGLGGGICLNRVRGGLYENLTIEDNEGGYGGGLYICHDMHGLDARRIEVRQCRVAANRARANGAGVYANAVTTNWLVNACTIVANTNVTANKEGAGFYFASVYNAGSHGTMALRNTLIATNVAAGATASKVDFAAATTATGVAGWDAGIDYCAVPQADAQLPAGRHNVLGGRFLFVDAAAGDYRPLRGSAPVNKGLTEGWMCGKRALDLSGARRLRGSAVDIGAYECQEKGLAVILR